MRNYLSAFDLEDERLLMRCFRRKRWQEILRFFKFLRARYPRSVRLYIILDNWSPHKKGEVVRRARRNNVFLVYTPTNASWLNFIFFGIHYFVFSNSGFTDHREINLVIRRYVRWRNSHPKDPRLRKIEERKVSSVTGH